MIEHKYIKETKKIMQWIEIESNESNKKLYEYVRDNRSSRAYIRDLKNGEYKVGLKTIMGVEKTVIVSEILSVNDVINDLYFAEKKTYSKH